MLRAFHPTVAAWFAERLGEPSAPQHQGWPAIRRGEHTLIAAPTGSGKTLAAFLDAIDRLLQQGENLRGETQVLYVSPLKALGNDVAKNLLAPLAELRARDATLPEVRVLVRSGDTPQTERTAMLRTPPHVLVTTPESLYILLTSDGGRGLLRTVRTVIIDEIHALARDKRGAHLSLSLERLQALVDAQGGALQRIGLSATQKPIEATAGLLAGAGRACTIVDCGHLRELDIALEVPGTPLETVCPTETWEQIYALIVAQIRAHRTTLVFVNTRKLAERVAARLSDVLGKEQVTSHHGSLSKERRLDAEMRLKSGSLCALVATASLELGIDVGEVDLAIQIGVPAQVATFLQRVGRAGHGKGRVPKGRIYPLTPDELVTAAALLKCVRARELDRTEPPRAPLDILAQQVVAACVPETWNEGALFERLRTAWSYRELTREQFDATVAVHTKGRHALLHRDGVQGRLRGTRRARLAAIQNGGAIPDVADYRVVQEPDGTYVGSVNEDFAIESSVGDVFQLGNTSWQVLKIEQGTLRVADAKGVPPSLPFWFGEAPARSEELSAAVSEVRAHGRDRAWLRVHCGLEDAAIEQIASYLEDGARVLGTVPTRERLVAERFFDDSGGMQLVVHTVRGGRINRALGLALRKRFCRSFGFELQAAANEDAIVISLGPMHAFELAEVFGYLDPQNVRDVLVQALLPAPMFQSRWRWNATRSLLVERMRGGRRVPAPLLRMRADDALAACFPQAQACPETLSGPNIEVPWEHPIVAQSVLDCLHEAMDLDGLIALLEELRDGRLETIAVDTPEPSAFAGSILHAMPYAFLDDAPLEERRTQAVLRPRPRHAPVTEDIGDLDPAAVELVRQQAWPQPENAEELHEALLWIGCVTQAEAQRSGWDAWLAELAAAERARCEDGRWFAAEATREPLAVLRGRMEALGPVVLDDPLLVTLESEGAVLRCKLAGADAWCDRRLLARVHRAMVEGLRREIEPVSASDFLAFLGAWQHLAPGHRLEGPRGTATVLAQLAGLEIPACAFEESVLPRRVQNYKREWLDQLTLSGELVWGRLWGSGRGALRNAPLTFVPRRDLAQWQALAARARSDDAEPLGGPAQQLQELLAARGAQFAGDLQQAAGLLPSYLEDGLAELVARGRATCDGFASLRQLLIAPSRRRFPLFAVGRWSLLAGGETSSELDPDFVLDRLLARWGVLFPRLLLKEKVAVTWRELLRALRTRELRGDLRGGRFVAGFAGEQFAHPDAVALLREVRRERRRDPSAYKLRVAAADPLNLRGILTPDARVSPTLRAEVEVG
jgi:ATP-dependent Lhr-like helicase